MTSTCKNCNASFEQSGLGPQRLHCSRICATRYADRRRRERGRANRASERRGCKVPKCHNKPRSRGLCTTHYLTARDLVQKGLTSWSKLVKDGKADEAFARPANTAREFFLSGRSS